MHGQRLTRRQTLGIIAALAALVLACGAEGAALEMSDPARYSGPGPAGVPASCLELVERNHHTATPWLIEALAQQRPSLLYTGKTGTVIITLQVAECGGYWLFAVFHNWRFVSNYFPEAQASIQEGFNYVTRQVSRYGLKPTDWSRMKHALLGPQFLMINPCLLPLELRPAMNCPNDTVQG